MRNKKHKMVDLKTLLVLICTLPSALMTGQVDSFQIYLDSGKAEFQKPFQERDHAKAARCFDRAIHLRPNSAVAHYNMGYAIDRINSSDGRSLLQSNPHLIDSASQYFLRTVELSPAYSSAILVLDPYSKQTALWGSQAVAYQARHMSDSASYCYQLGRSRRGFSPFFLEYNRQVLASCDSNAILVVNGDNCTFPLMYLQHEEGFRTDVLVVDNTLLNTKWYHGFLETNFEADFGIHALDSATVSNGYTSWSDSLVTINAPDSESFSWVLYPTYYENYILSGELRFLELLRENAFEHEVRFIIGIDPGRILGLKEYFAEYVISQELSVPKPSIDTVMAEFERQYEDALTLFALMDTNRYDEQAMMHGIRVSIVRKVIYLAQNERKPEARVWLARLEADFGSDRLPLRFADLKPTYAAIKDLLAKPEE